MAMALRVFFALGLVFAISEASNLRGDVPEADDPNAQVSQADIQKAMAEATAGDGLSATDLMVNAESHESGGEEERESQEQEEAKELESEKAGEEAVERKHHTHDAILVTTVKHDESRQSQLQALEAKKSAAVAAEDYDEANKIKKEIIALKAKKSEDHTAEIATLEAKKKAAVEAEDYDEATKLKKEIEGLKEKDSVQPEIQEQQPEQEPEPQQSDDGNDDQSHSHKKSLLSTEKAKTQSQEEQPEQQAEQEAPKDNKPVRMTAKFAEETALKTDNKETDDEEAKEMAEFDRKHGLSPDGNDKKEAAFQKQMQEVYDSTTESEEDAELEMKASELRKAKKLSNGGEFESVDDVRDKMKKEQHDAEIRKKELAGFDDFFSDAGTDAGKGSVAPHSAAALAALIPAKSSAATSAASSADMGNMMSMFSSMMGGGGGMGGMDKLMGGMDKLSHHDVEKEEPAEKPAEHHGSAATQDLMKALSGMAKGGNMDLGALVSLAGGADKGKAKQGLLAIEQAPKAIALGNKVEHATAPKAQIITKVVAAKAVNFGAVIKKADKAAQEAKVAKETTKATEKQLAAHEAHAEHTTVDVTHLYDAAKKRLTVEAVKQIAKVVKKKPSVFSVGQEVEARNQAFDWIAGKVISTSPLMVKRDGDWFANKFDEVRKPVFAGWNLLAHKKAAEVKKIATKPKVATPKEATEKVSSPKKVAAKVATVVKPAVAVVAKPAVVAVAKPAVVAVAKPAVVAAAKPAAIIATAIAATSEEDADVEDAEKAAAEIDAEVNAEMGTK